MDAGNVSTLAQDRLAAICRLGETLALARQIAEQQIIAAVLDT